MAYNIPQIFSTLQLDSHILPFQIAPSQIASSSFDHSDPLEEILSLSNVEIFHKGVPLALIKVWRDRFYEGLEGKEQSILLKLSRDDAWAYDRFFFETGDKEVEIGFDETGSLFMRQSTHQDHFVSEFHHMMHPAFWEDRSRHSKILLSLYRLHKIVAFSQDDPVEKVFLKLMDCVVEKMAAHQPKLQGSTFFSFALPNSADHEVAKNKRLCCFKTAMGWRVGDCNAFPDTDIRIVQFNTNHTKKLILDKSNQPFNRPSVVVEAGIRPEAEGDLTKIVKVNIVLCTGPRELSHDQRNAVTFTFDIDLRQSPLKMERFRQNSPWITDLSEHVEQIELENVKNQAELMFEVFQKEITAPFIAKPDSHVVFELVPPKSSSDKLWVLAGLLDILKKDPVGYSKEIAFVAEKMNCTFSEEELVTLSMEGNAELTLEGDYTVSPDVVAEKLYASVRTQFLQALQPPSLPANSSPSSIALPLHSPKKAVKEDEVFASSSAPVEIPIDFPMKAVVSDEPSDPVKASSDIEPLSLKQQEEVDRRQRLMEKEVEKARRREAFEYKQRKLEAEALERKTKEERSHTLFTLDFEDQQQVDSIYKGYPMKAKDFTAFAMNLLQKKANALGATLHQNIAGSHPKLHFKRADGPSGGVTFRIHHGGDDHGFASNQKDTLNRIFQL
ncbi:MAG: hypothetical protein KF898_04160 [Parachlamydiales bacterium]|nr:hypothetical protein [Verrucomicrobiota bacterium]MBX3718825.1 hypothetical protein [Candidatus Acheromyda pituitae]